MPIKHNSTNLKLIMVTELLKTLYTSLIILNIMSLVLCPVYRLMTEFQRATLPSLLVSGKSRI